MAQSTEEETGSPCGAHSHSQVSFITREINNGI